MANKDGFDALVEDGQTTLGKTADQGARATAELDAELARLRQSMLYTNREMASLTSGIGRGLRRAFEGLAFDGMKLSDALKGIARSMADTAFSVAMRPVEQAVSGALAQGVNGLVSGLLPFADGAAFAQGRVMPFARGGVVSQPTYFPMRGATGLMGEAGAEAIMPLQRGADGRLGVAAQGAAARPVNVTFNVSTPDVAGFQRSQSQIAAQMGRLLARGERNG
ncbi:phage tail tape measure protein, lambda family [Paracoccus halophilus]|uniref:Phage tail tape measure protein, lambda family n=1 Tax=Paracoccus halophilus TaxID=376733 RepID=A0A099F2Z4_9RHOB|nr:phage tail tape measure protein [Paracoccus halophilus]KGJ04819.1 tail protein [Paracoccus halophilus]SFA51353.1 phage tail tape measure protein, lambda family [Paracoccus halophilus]